MENLVDYIYELIINTVKWLETWSVLSGIILGSILSWLFSRQLTKNELKKSLELKAAEEIQKKILELYDKKIGIGFSTLNVSIDIYNSLLSFYQSSDYKYDNNKNVIECFDEINKNWIEYCTALSSLLYNFEVREIILFKFKGIKWFLQDHHRLLSDIYQEIVTLYYKKISREINLVQPIENAVIEELKVLTDKFFVKDSDITCILYDLNIALQNNFLSKTFKKKVELRKPKGDIFPVLKAGFRYEPDETKIKLS